jgi:uncharacterized protein YajQ (UPF0234 family)
MAKKKKAKYSGGTIAELTISMNCDITGKHAEDVAKLVSDNVPKMLANIGIVANQIEVTALNKPP